MFDTYLKLERTPAMERAIARSRKNRVKVHTVSIDARLYTVESRSQRGVHYVVKFEVAGGKRLVACSCPAGQRGIPCAHIPAVYAVHVANVRARQRASASAPLSSLRQEIDAAPLMKREPQGVKLGGYQI